MPGSSLGAAMGVGHRAEDVALFLLTAGVMTSREANRANLERALGVLRAGGLCVLGDDEAHGDLVSGADRIDGTAINFMAQHGRGLICLALPPAAVDRLGLPPMSRGWNDPRCAYTVSIEARHGITTGISARERAHTIRVAVDPASGPADLVVPGHVFPVRARSGGLLAGGGRAEAALDLVEAAGAGGAAVFTQILDDDGDLARLSERQTLLGSLGLPVVQRSELLAFLRAERVGEGVTAPVDGPPARVWRAGPAVAGEGAVP
ncbi:MAG TPA: 3,4-dihydroxy-2-butanone-4-phosphate synthase [Polyangia bacterium]